MEYSSTKKVRLPGISALLVDDDDDDDEDDSLDGRGRAVAPFESDDALRSRNSAAARNSSAAGPRTPPNAEAAPRSGAESGRKPPSRRSTFSPTSRLLIHATAEALAADRGPTSFAEAVVDGLDGLGEMVRFGLFGGAGGGSRGEGGAGADRRASGGGRSWKGRREDRRDGDPASGRADGDAVARPNADADDAADDSATRSFAPPPTAPRREADATFSSEETDSFYIGLGEDGFCPSASVHESDISESDVEAESTEDEFEESEVSEDGEGEGRDEVNVSILTEYGAVDEAADDGARRGLDTSILTEIMAEETGDWEDEKKEETACVVAEAEETNQSNEAMPARSTLSVNEIASSPVPSLPPVPLQTTPLDVEDSEDDDEDFVSSSLKNYLTETEANLATFMSSIECMTTTPGRIVNAVQLGMQAEEDLDDSISMTGLTPLQSRFERIDDAEHRSGVLFHSPPGVNDSVAKPSGWEQRFDEADSEVLGLPSPPEVSEETGLESDHRGGLLLHSPPVMSQLVSTTKTSGFEKSSSTKHEHTLPQSPLPASLETPLAETNEPTTSSPFEVATTEFSTKSTKVMDQLHKAIETKLYLDSPQQPSHAKKITRDEPQQFTSQSLSPSVECRPKPSADSPIQNQCDDSLESADLDAIPASLREMFKNAEELLEKELASPVLKNTHNIDVEGDGTFCDDYIEPPADASKCVEPSAPFNVDQMPFASPLNSNGLDSLKGAFLKAELHMKMESAAEYRNNEEQDDNSVADTTFNTANYSIGEVVESSRSPDDFFDAREEFASFERFESIPNDDQSDMKKIEAGASKETNYGKSPAVNSRLSMGTATDSDDNVGITPTLDRVGEYLKRMTMEDSDIVQKETDTTPIDSLPNSPENVQYESFVENVIDGVTPRACNSVLRSNKGLLGSSPHSNILDESMLSPLVPNVKFGRSNSNDASAPHVNCESNLGSSSLSNIMDQSMLSPLVPNVKFGRTENCDDACHERNAPTLESSMLSDVMDESMESPDKTMLDPNLKSECSGENSYTLSRDRSVGAGAETKSTAKNDYDTPRGYSPSTMEASARSDDMDESLFMPNASMEVSVILSSPAPAVGVEQQLPAMSEEDEDSGALSDEEFFPNRDLAKKATAKVVVSSSNKEKTSRLTVSTSIEATTPAPSPSLAEGSSAASKKPAKVPSSQPQPNANSPENQRKVSSANPACLTRQNSRKAALKSPPSNIKPAKKRTKLSTITNTDSPKPTAKPLNPTTKTEESVQPTRKLPAIEKKRVPRPTAAITMSKAASKATSITGVSPRTSSMRRSLVAVAKSQTQMSIPKPSPRVNLSQSERLARLAKPRSVSAAQKEKSSSPTKSVTNNSERLARLARPRSVVHRGRSPSPSKEITHRSSTANARRNSKATSITGVSPRTLSMRRSLAAVAKSQTQISIPKPSPRVNLSQSEKLARLAKQRSVSVARKEKYPSPTKKVTSNSERLARLARPRSVRRERSPSPPKEISHRIIAAAKPPTFLNREIKKSRVKSTEELEAEEMSSVKPFKARKIKGSNSEIASRFNTPRATTPAPTHSDNTNPGPFKSLRESIDNYNFREPAKVATPVNTKRLCDSTPSFLERELSKPPKPNVATLAESINSYDFRGAGPPVATTPISSKAKPPSFLIRPPASHNLPMSSEERELEECKHKFKACPLPLQSTTKLRPPSRPSESRTLTTPRPPKLHTEMRSEQLRTPVPTQDEIELQNKFHARPLPTNIYGHSFTVGTPSRHYEKTPQPTTDEVELSKKFHALPLPTEIYGRTIENDGTPVHIRLEQQYERAQERKKQTIEGEMEEMRRNRERKAMPLPPTNWEARPIRIEKSNVELVQPCPPRLSLDVRSRDRKQYDAYIQQVREADAAAEAARLAEEARAEEEEVKRKRSLTIEEGGLCFRARPISIRYE